MQSGNCPVCDGSVDNMSVEYCPSCSWELISIPGNSSEWLKQYYEKKVALWKVQHARIQSNEQRMRNDVEQIYALTQQLNELKEKDKDVESLKARYKSLQEENKSLAARIQSYESKYGDSWISNSSKTKSPITITWEKLSDTRFRFYSENIHQDFPDKVVLLFKKDTRPVADGDFHFAYMLDTQNKHKVDAYSCEFEILKDELPKGRYFVKFTNLNYGEKNILFFHKEQVNRPTFEWSKTIINL